ncbi:hypothetical protein L9F63_018710 [Diploptera punctata]|uniref:Vitellogenin domain-containing protein n=1 Tax=Diploptera punctata TaxID=6984 RepID=A0AAD7ZW94_DIPPU|nr:hypothetical protein L9F63_018710 [Diploptera punctata]
MAKQVTSIGHSVLFTLLLLLLVAVSASPLRKKGCHGKIKYGKLNYEIGHTYVYNFEGHTVASLPGQQGDGVKLNLKAKAEISIEDNCRGVIKLDGLQVTGPDAQKHAHLDDLEGHEVEFDFEDGVVGRDLLTVEADSEASVNLKRAILSLFQIKSLSTLSSGKSTVLKFLNKHIIYFSITERGNSAYITKFRNLNHCHLREHLRQDFASVTYHVESDLQTTPLLEATQEVKQQLKGGVLNTAESHEKYIFKPFSNQDAGAKTLVDSKLTLAGHNKKAAPAVSGNEVRSIVFEPTHTRIGSGNAAAVVEALHKAHEAMPQYIGETAAKEFSNVVNIVRQTSKDDLLSVYSQVKAGAGFKDKNAGTKMFLDALFRAGTGEAVEVAVELLKSNKITGPLAELYYLQFAYTKHVTKSALNAAVSLLDLPHPSKLAYLGIGALGGRYCAQHTCDGVPEVDAFLEKLSHALDGGCKVSSYEDEVKVIAALKALHNVHHLNSAVIAKLKTCVLDDHVPVRVRASVLDVFQSDACKVKDISFEVLKDIQLDSELRIKAFLALVECPCNKMSNPLKELLDAEPSYQVGSFIASYLRNLRATANPSKEHQKAVYGQIRSVKKFPIDLRKFSNNFEYSYLLGGMNVGTTAESNLIYSQKSFLPRVSTLNLTSEVFGHSINFLELELRQENLDLLAEKLFGPKSYFNTHTIIRSEKSTSPFDSEPDREVLLEISTRLFGAEVGWLAYHHDARDAANNAFDSFFKIVEKVVVKLKDFDYKLRQHNTFLDTELVYPTALGLPLKLVVTGSSAVHVELEGKIDLDQLLNDYKNSDLHFKLVPSAAVEVVGTFEVDAYAVEAGLKVATTLHTATGTDINVKSTAGVGIDITLGLPVQKQDVLTVKTEVLTTFHERGKPEVDKEIAFPSTPKRSYHGCFDQLSRLVGLTFCGTVNFPWDPVASKAAFFPLNGPSKFSLVIENEDVKKYHFRASLNNADPNKKSLGFLLETPGSQTDRKLELLLERTYSPYQGLKAKLDSPWKQVSAEVAFTDSDKELSLLAKATNDDQEYYAKLGALVTGDSSHATYHPLLEYKTPERHGSLVSKKGAKGRQQSQPFTVTGSVTVDRSPDSRKYTFNDVVFSTPQGEYKVEGSVVRESGNKFSTDLTIHYGSHHVVLKSAYNRPARGEVHLNLNVQPSQYRDFGVNLIWDYKHSSNNVSFSNLLK